MDLFSADPLSQAVSDAGWKTMHPGIRAIWTGPLEGEDEAPRQRIIHCRLLQLHEPALLERLGLRPAPGYHKCGSQVQIDWVTSVRLLLWDGARWVVHLYQRNLPSPPDSKPIWFDLGSTRSSAAIVELRSCGVDQWWTSWNLAAGACLLEGEFAAPGHKQIERRLKIAEIDLSNIPTGISAEQKPGEIRFRTRCFEVGFSLGRAGFSFLGLDDEERGRTGRNLLRLSPAFTLQGLRFHPVGGLPAVAPVLRNEADGEVIVRGNTVRYDIRMESVGQAYELEWTVLQDSIRFRIARRGSADVRLWESAAWLTAFYSEVAPATVLGNELRSGETGLLQFPALLHAPGHGTLRCVLTGGNAVLRSDSCRPLLYTSLEFKVGEIPQPEGDYLLPSGEYQAEGSLALHQHEVSLQSITPPVVARAIRRCAISAMTYRADTGTLSNNGNSIHAPLCMDTWSGLAPQLGDLLPDLPALDLVRRTLERWLDGGPGYGSGGMIGRDGVHRAEDEYIMTGTAALLGLAEYLEASGSRDWLDTFAPQIRQQIDLMRNRDADGDGIVESIYRTGKSGGYQWSTNWYDVVSFGWKDALSNALLYRALDLLAHVFSLYGRPDLSIGLPQWRDRLKGSYLSAFLNTESGWLAGWRCTEGRLHDYAFLAVNGAAVCSGVVEGEQARRIIQSLWAEAIRVGLPDPRLGLPGNLRRIPDSDMVPLMHGRAMGYYINGGLTHSQSCRFVEALYRVGMNNEAESLLEALSERLADCSAFGGCNSGIDWRYWDGGPCGYEGLLTDQFGILAIALDRYGTAT